MKRNESFPKYVQAMHLMDAGESVNYICKLLRMTPNSLYLARQRYIAGGEMALSRPGYLPHLDPKRKWEILQDIEKNSLPLSVASLKYGILRSTIRSWQHAYQRAGLTGLGRPKRMKQNPKRTRTEAELDELEVLRRRNEYLEAENALLKKVKALVEEREARLREIGRKPSKD